jgi:hypothetical protein
MIEMRSWESFHCKAYQKKAFALGSIRQGVPGSCPLDLGPCLNLKPEHECAPPSPRVIPIHSTLAAELLELITSHGGDRTCRPMSPLDSHILIWPVAKRAVDSYYSYPAGAQRNMDRYLLSAS